MSDILATLLDSYYDDIGLKMVSGQALDYLGERYQTDPGALQNPDWAAPLPFCLIYPSLETLQPNSVGLARSDLRTYQIGLSIYQDATDNTIILMGSGDVKGALTIKEDFDALYARQTFSVSMSCILTQIAYSRLSLPHLGDLFCVTLSLQHTWIDAR